MREKCTAGPPGHAHDDDDVDPAKAPFTRVFPKPPKGPEMRRLAAVDAGDLHATAPRPHVSRTFREKYAPHTDSSVPLDELVVEAYPVSGGGADGGDVARAAVARRQPRWVKAVPSSDSKWANQELRMEGIREEAKHGTDRYVPPAMHRYREEDKDVGQWRKYFPNKPKEMSLNGAIVPPLNADELAHKIASDPALAGARGPGGKWIAPEPKDFRPLPPRDGARAHVEAMQRGGSSARARGRRDGRAAARAAGAEVAAAARARPRRPRCRRRRRPRRRRRATSAAARRERAAAPAPARAANRRGRRGRRARRPRAAARGPFRVAARAAPAAATPRRRAARGKRRRASTSSTRARSPGLPTTTRAPCSS